MKYYLRACMGLPLGWLLGCAGEEPPSEPDLGATVYVDESAAEGGDGSQQRPYRTVREALELQRRHDEVVIASGDYPVPSPWTFAGPLRITGAASTATRLRVEAGGERIDWTASTLLTLGGLSFAAPLDLHDGELALQDVEISGVTGPALVLSDASASFALVSVSEVSEVSEQPGTGDGIDISGGSLSWHGGSVDGVPDRALVLHGVTATLDSLSLNSARRAPLTVIEGSEVVASAVTIDEVSVAVFVRTAQLDLVGAHISHGQTAGLLLSGDSTTRLVDSTISDCPQGQVALIGAAANLDMQGNTLKNASMAPCVSAQTDGHIVIRDNLLDGCAGAGIALSAVAGAVVEDNTVENITPDPLFPELADGITLLDGEATISGNVVADTAGYGIALIRGHGTIESNTIGPTASAGISIVEQGAAPVMVSLNTITAATGAGVTVISASAVIDQNTISATSYSPAEALGDGIAFALGADVVASHNLISANAVNGIVFLDGVTGELTDNTSSDNSWYGIREYCTGEPNAVTLSNNIMANNGAGPTDLCSP